MRKALFSLIIGFLFSIAAIGISYAISPPIPPFGIYGYVTVNGTQLTNATATGYTFVVTKQNGNAYVPAAQDTNGLVSNWYSITTPISTPDYPGGANTGDTAIIHVYYYAIELQVTSPANGAFTVGGSGDGLQINLVATLDSDGDGLADNVDNCPLLANADQADNDGDGSGNVCDIDYDNDGVLDGSDSAPLNPSVCRDTDTDTCDDCSQNPTTSGSPTPWPIYIPSVVNDGTDTDSDVACNAGDTDDDNDGVLDGQDPSSLNPGICGDTDADTCDDCSVGTDNFGPLSDKMPANDGTDTDSDGACNAGDTNDDGDGFSDANEITCGSDPLNAASVPADFDLDGLCDNGVDADDDADGVLDVNDNCRIASNADQADNDADGAGNACDSDDDNDSVPDVNDNCSLISNLNQLNTDGDAFGDACDADDDNDGVLDASDNCSLVSNADQADADFDGPGNACDQDDDNDTVLDGSDNCPLTPNLDQLNTDGDAQGNACDTDDDADGVLDASDNCSLILNANQSNNDGDAFGDVCDADDDNDTVLDGSDNCPLAANADQADADVDGSGNACDSDDDGDGVADANDSAPLNRNICRDADADSCDDCTSGTANPANDGTDNDTDGLCNAGDTDDDNDGALDGVDDNDNNPNICNDSDNDTCDDCVNGTDNQANDGTDTDNDGACNTGDTDDDGDGFSDAHEGTCGSNPLLIGSVPADFDHDGLCDNGVDPDDDNDGVSDANDTNDNNPNVCNDSDADSCDDCTNGTDDPANDGTDNDSDGLCNAGDTDDDNDGALDANDSNDNNANVCNDSDSDTCDDCINGTDNPANDGTDSDSDGLCNAGDTDDDNDGALDGVDDNDNNPNICNDSDNDTCNDCTNGTDNPANDGTDSDSDGLCNAGDTDDDNDGALDANDTNDNNPNICNDTDGDTCDDCANGTDNPANDGLDANNDGQCETEFGDAPDPAYPSANHLAFTKEWLGADVDGEADSNQINNDEHDDGVLFVFNEQNKLSRIEVTVSVDNHADAIRYDSAAAGKRLYLNAWIDLNNNGSWADTGDKVIGTDSGKIYLGRPTDLFTIDPVAEAWTDDAMTYVFNLPSPIDWPIGGYARVRLAYGEDVDVDGTALYGEVEDYLNPILSSNVVNAATGGNNSVVNNGSPLMGTMVDIPADALDVDTTITIEEVQNAGDLPPTPDGGIAVLADFGPNGTLFITPVTITIPHDASLVHSSSPQVYFWDDSLPTPAWSSEGITDIVLDETSDPHTVTFKVSHFTIFGSDLGTAPASASAGSSGSGGGGCFIATAAYGSYLDKNVMILREFRDNHLLTNIFGKSFVRLYYAYSPPVADYIAGHKALKIATRLMLTPVVYGVKYPQLMLLTFGFIAVGIFWSRKKKVK